MLVNLSLDAGLAQLLLDDDAVVTQGIRATHADVCGREVRVVLAQGDKVVCVVWLRAGGFCCGVSVCVCAWVRERVGLGLAYCRRTSSSCS